MEIRSESFVIRSSCLPMEDKPHRHKFYKFLGKVGTTATTIIWVIDKGTILLNDEILYIDESDRHPYDKNSYMKYLNVIHRGIVDKINNDGYIFVNKLSDVI